MESFSKTLFKQSMLPWITGIIFIGFTIILIIKTWNIQHSCNPMFGCPDTTICSRKTAKPSTQDCYRRNFKLPQIPLPKVSKFPKLKMPEFNVPDFDKLHLPKFVK